MKLIKTLRSRQYGLRGWFGRTLILLTAVCLALFFALHLGVNAFLAHRNSSSKHIEKRTSVVVEDLQSYITDNDISSDELFKLEDWKMRNPVVLMEFYNDGMRIYSSADLEGIFGTDADTALKDWEKTYNIELRDMSVKLLIYCDFSFMHYTLAMIVEGSLCFLVFIGLFIQRTSVLIKYICRLNDDVQIIEGGSLDYEILVQGNNELSDLAISMNSLRRAFRAKSEQEAQLHDAYRRLITEMSHDLRTPLTSILLYTEILRSGRYEGEEQMQEYLDKLDTKAHQLKQMSDNLFEYTLDQDARSRGVGLNTPVLFEQAIKRLADDAQSYLSASGFTLETNLEWNNVYITYNRDYLFRVGDNICSNIIKYAEKSAPVFINTVYTEKYAGISVMNTITQNLKQSGTKIGLDSIRAMMEEMNGICSIEKTDISFEITVLFPIV